MNVGRTVWSTIGNKGEMEWTQARRDYEIERGLLKNIDSVYGRSPLRQGHHQLPTTSLSSIVIGQEHG